MFNVFTTYWNHCGEFRNFHLNSDIDLIISIWLTPFLVTACFLLAEGFPDPFLPGHYQTLLTADSLFHRSRTLSWDLLSSAFTWLNSTFTDSSSIFRAIFSFSISARMVWSCANSLERLPVSPSLSINSWLRVDSLLDQADITGATKNAPSWFVSDKCSPSSLRESTTKVTLNVSFSRHVRLKHVHAHNNLEKIWLITCAS